MRDKPDASGAQRAGSSFEEFLEFVPDAVVGVGGDGRIVLANGQAEALFGYGREDLVGKPIEALVPARFREAHREHRSSYFEQPRTRPMGVGVELFALRADGGEFPVEVSLSHLELGGGRIAVAAVRDISERAASEREQALQDQLHRARRLESVGQLAGGIAHDFNNILGVIMNYAEFVADAVPGDSPAQEDVEEIRRAAERAAALTRQLLIFSRRDVVKPELLYLREVVGDLENLLRRALGERVELATRFGEQRAPVEIDAGQLEQVLVNLAVNGRDAMPDGGRLTIAVDITELDEEYAYMHPGTAPGRYACLKVSDTGVGMDAETADRIFEPFFTTKDDGTGLGMATVYGIVTGAAGRLDVYSEPGIGTTIKVHLPIAAGAPRGEGRGGAPGAGRARRGRAGGRGRARRAADGRTDPLAGRLHGDRQRRRVGGARGLLRRPPRRPAADRRDHARDAGDRAGRARARVPSRAARDLHVRLQPRRARAAGAVRARRQRLHREAVQRPRAARGGARDARPADDASGGVSRWAGTAESPRAALASSPPTTGRRCCG